MRLCGDWNVEHTVVIDLDREILVIDEMCFLHLDQLPDDLDPLIEPAKEYALGLVAEPEFPCITTNVLPAPSISDKKAIASQYQALQPRLLAPFQPKRESSRATETLSSMARAYTLAIQQYEHAFTQARDRSDPMLPLFQEVSWLVIGMACCSPKYISLANAGDMGWPANLSKYTTECPIFKYGILGDMGDTQPPELVSTFLSDFHADGKIPGSAPSKSWYWMGQVLVWLTPVLVSRSGFEAALCAAVAKGRDEGMRQFSVLLFSIRHFVFANVTPEKVEHSKRYALWTEPSAAQRAYLENSGNPLAKIDRLKKLLDRMNYGEPGDGEWVAVKNLHGFNVLAGFLLWNADVAMKDIPSKYFTHCLPQPPWLGTPPRLTAFGAISVADSRSFSAHKELAIDRHLMIVESIFPETVLAVPGGRSNPLHIGFASE